MPNKRMGPPKRMSKGMHKMPSGMMMKDAEMDEMMKQRYPSMAPAKKMAPKRKK